MQLSPPSSEPCYEVEFVDGKKYVVNAESWLSASRKAVKLHEAETKWCYIKDVNPVGPVPDIFVVRVPEKTTSPTT